MGSVFSRYKSPPFVNLDWTPTFTPPLVKKRHGPRARCLQHLINTVGASQVVLGTDFPFAMGNVDSIDHILSVSGIGHDELEGILGGTLAELLNIESQT